MKFYKFFSMLLLPMVRSETASAVPSFTPSSVLSFFPSALHSSLPSGDPSMPPDYGVTTTPATSSKNIMSVVTTFGFSSDSPVIKLMSPNCTTVYDGNLLTKARKSTDWGGPKSVTETVTVDPGKLEDVSNVDVVFGNSTSGKIIFCIKSHSTHTTKDGFILMEVKKTRYAIEYSGEDKEFDMAVDIVEEEVSDGNTFEDGVLIASSTVLVHRCSKDSTEKVESSPIKEESILYLCIGATNDNPIVDISMPNIGLELKDINLQAKYGDSSSLLNLNLVIDSAAEFTFVNIGKSNDSTGWTRISIPILSEFIEKASDASNINLKLTGDADVAFVQNVQRLDARRLDNVAVPFEFNVQLVASDKMGCILRIYNTLNGFFL